MELDARLLSMDEQQLRDGSEKIQSQSGSAVGAFFVEAFREMIGPNNGFLTGLKQHHQPVYLQELFTFLKCD